jgi:hypothetical protein
LKAVEANARIDRQRRQKERERVEAAKRERASHFLGTRVSAPGPSPEPDWASMPSSPDDE